MVKTTKKRLAVLLTGTLLTGLTCGYTVGHITAPERITFAETVDVPVASTELVEPSDVRLVDIPLSESMQRYITEICADTGVPTSLIFAMIEHESNFNPEAVSATNDYGLMQINEINHERLENEYRCANMLDPYQNVYCGIKIIGSYVAKYDGDINKALMAYNMGHYGARKAWENGIESTAYSDEIMSLMRSYEVETMGCAL